MPRRYNNTRRRRLQGGKLALRGRNTARLATYNRDRAYTGSLLGAFGRRANKAVQLYDLAQGVYAGGKYIADTIKDIPPGHEPIRHYGKTIGSVEKQYTKRVNSGMKQGKQYRKDQKNKRKEDKHKTLPQTSAGPVNKGKGYNTSPNGTIVTHPYLPKYKRDREKLYKHPLWQKICVSRSSRILNSDNILNIYRYPVKLKEALDADRIQCTIFPVYPSVYSGVHTTYTRHIRADGTDLEHNTSQPYDVVQNKADTRRHNYPPEIEATYGTQILYQNDTTTAGTTQTVANMENNNVFYDILLKNINIDLTFISSRAFPVRCSISVIRHITPVTPYSLTTENKQQIFNSLGYKGLDWNKFKVEWCHEWVQPALVKNKKPPMKHINKKIKLHAMITNSFNDNKVSDDMTNSAQTQLGLGYNRRHTEVADPDAVSGMVWIIIKYKKLNTPQVFEYTQVIAQDTAGSGAGHATASITLPVITEESFDVPNDGLGDIVANDNPPFENTQGDESKASAYMMGVVNIGWRTTLPTEGIPSVMSQDPLSADYKKTQSLNIDPTIMGDNGFGLYTQSPSHQTRAVT